MAQDYTINVKVQGTGKVKQEIEGVGKSASAAGDLAGQAFGPLDGVLGGLPSKFMAAKKGVGALNLGFKGMKAAIAATGIGLFVIAISEIAANWEDVSGFVKRTVFGYRDLVEEQKLVVQEAQNILDQQIQSENILRLQGKSQRQILEMRMFATDEVIEQNKQLLEQLQTELELAKVLDAMSGINPFAESKFDEVTEQIKETESTILNLENSRAGMQLRLKEIDEREIEELKRKNKEADDLREQNIKSEQDAANALIQAEQDVIDALDKRSRDALDARTKEILALEDFYNAQLDKAGENAELIAQIELQREEDLAAMRERFRQEDAENAEAARQKELKAQEEAGEKEKQLVQQIEDAKAQLKTDAVSSTFSILKNLTAASEKDTEQSAKKAFERNKAISIAETLVNTYMAAQKAYASQIIPLDPTSVIRAQIAAGVAVASGLAKVAAIKSTQFSGAGAAGGAATAGGSFRGGGFQSVGVDVGTLVPDTTQTTPEPVRAYVVSNEISNQQALDRELQIQTTL